MKISKLSYLIFIIPILSTGQVPKSNLDWISNNLDTLFDSLNVLDSIDNHMINVSFGAVKGEKKGFIKSRVLKYFRNEIGENIKSDKYKIHIEQFKADIVYEQSSSGFLNFGTHYLRKNKIILIGWIEESNSQSVKLFSFNKVFQNDLENADFTALEESPYLFTRGQAEELSIWTSTIEPVLVGASVVAIVYLFFSVRS